MAISLERDLGSLVCPHRSCPHPSYRATPEWAGIKGKEKVSQVGSQKEWSSS
jgi:hypothetical protein